MDQERRETISNRMVAALDVTRGHGILGPGADRLRSKSLSVGGPGLCGPDPRPGGVETGDCRPPRGDQRR